VELVRPTLESLCGLDRACFSDPYALTTWRSYLDQPHRFQLFAFQSDGESVGYACFSVILPEAELLRIGVVQTKRGQGVARSALLLAQRELHLIGVSRVMLEVRESNLAARKLYQRLGYIKDGERPHYYPAEGNQPAEAALLMSLSL